MSFWNIMMVYWKQKMSDSDHCYAQCWYYSREGEQLWKWDQHHNDTNVVKFPVSSKQEERFFAVHREVMWKKPPMKIREFYLDRIWTHTRLDWNWQRSSCQSYESEFRPTKCICQTNRMCIQEIVPFSLEFGMWLLIHYKYYICWCDPWLLMTCKNHDQNSSIGLQLELWIESKSLLCW